MKFGLHSLIYSNFIDGKEEKRFKLLSSLDYDYVELIPINIDSIDFFDLKKKAEDALKKSDIIIICPGDLYGSIIPNFLVSGVNKAIQKSKAKIVYICNLVTKQGTYGFKAGDFVSEIEKYLGGGKIDIVVLNKKKPSQKTVDKYKGENSFFVEPDVIDSQKKVIKENLLLEHKVNKRIIARHNPEKIKKIIQRIIRSKDC